MKLANAHNWGSQTQQPQDAGGWGGLVSKVEWKYEETCCQSRNVLTYEYTEFDIYGSELTTYLFQ